MSSLSPTQLGHELPIEIIDLNRELSEHHQKLKELSIAYMEQTGDSNPFAFLAATLGIVLDKQYLTWNESLELCKTITNKLRTLRTGLILPTMQ